MTWPHWVIVADRNGRALARQRITLAMLPAAYAQLLAEGISEPPRKTKLKASLGDLVKSKPAKKRRRRK